MKVWRSRADVWHSGPWVRLGRRDLSAGCHSTTTKPYKAFVITPKSTFLRPLPTDFISSIYTSTRSRRHDLHPSRIAEPCCRCPVSIVASGSVHALDSLGSLGI